MDGMSFLPMIDTRRRAEKKWRTDFLVSYYGLRGLARGRQPAGWRVGGSLGGMRLALLRCP